VPAMPWDRTTVWVAALTRPGAARQVLDSDESAFCPQWSPDSVLHVVSDRTGWWNLHRLTGDRWQPVLAADAELGVAQWELGYTTYALLGEDRLAVITQRGPHHELLVGPADALRPAAPAYTSIKPYLSTDGRHRAVIGASTTQQPTVVTIDLTTGEPQELTSPVRVDTDTAPEPFLVLARDGRPMHGLYWPPRDRHLRPPTILRAHPGPTAACTGRLDDYVRFFTSHGYAVADLDYRGSTGHGRDHRHALRGQWGIADAHDCIDAARHLIDHGRADPRRTMISGSSAGGFTALHALADPDTPFATATARSAVIDPVAWRAAAPRFQAHHTDLLIGPWPGTAATHHERSLLTQAHRIRRPVLLIHGTDDTIAPPAPALHLAAVLRRSGTACTLLTLDHEGHTLTAFATHATHVAELRHYTTIT
jgi:dipeptidyl aminopeptidase/acylaminoacyl peptidase